MRPAALALLLVASPSAGDGPADRPTLAAPTVAAVLSAAPVSPLGPAGVQDAPALSEAELDRLAAEVGDRLRCPVCRNQSIFESPSELAREMQAVIRERLAAGDSPEEVKAYFVSRYGEWVLLKPEPRGLNLLVYILPAFAFLLGGGLVGWRLRRWSADRRGRPAADAPGEAPTPGPTPADVARDFSEEEEAWLRDAIGRDR